MKLVQEKGGYASGIVRLHGSFATHGSSAPDTLRDGHCSLITGVTRVSAGLYKVALNVEATLLPHKLVDKFVHLESSATPTIIAQANYVQGSWDPVAKTFEIVVYHTSATAGVGDPDTGSVINFMLVGSILGVGQDVA